MGIFDFLTRGPKLKRYEAFSICKEFAMYLYTGELSVDIYVIKFESILEKIFQRDYPDRSINAEESKQIAKFALFIYEKHKEFLEATKPNSELYGKDIPLGGKVLGLGKPWTPYPDDPEKFADSFLSLFNKRIN